MSIKVYVIWGEHPEPGTKPTEYEFETEAEVDAFWLGVTEGDGWMGWEPVDGPDYTVDEFGDVMLSTELEWRRKANELIQARYGCDITDFPDPTEEHLKEPPEVWVEWWAEKNELTPIRGGLQPW